MSDILSITPDEGKTYKTTLAQEFVPTEVKVGDAGDKFLPKVHSGKWGEEAWLDFSPASTPVLNETEDFIDGKIELIIGDRKHRFYELDKDHFEYDIILSSRPALDVVEFDIDFPKGLDFNYQDTLYNYWLTRENKAKNHATFEDFQKHGGRPANVEGSYAVYWNKKNNQYQTGKFCHIYRPIVTDSALNQTYCDIEIDPVSKGVLVRIPGKWLDSAIFPIILDPTLGYSTTGGSWYGSNTEKYGTFYQTDGTGGDVVNIYLGVYQVDATNNNCKWGLWDAPATGNSMVGESLLEQHEWNPVATGNNETASGSTSSLAANSWFCMAYIPEASNTQGYYDGGGGRGAMRSSVTYSAEMQDPGESGWDTATSDQDTIYLTYEPVVGGVSPTGNLAGPLYGPLGGVI